MKKYKIWIDFSKKIDLVIKNQGPDGFTDKFHQTFTDKWMPILLKVFQNIEEEEILSTHFYGDSVTLMPKSDKNTAMKRKKMTGQYPW